MERERFRLYWGKLRDLWPPYPKENDAAKFAIYYKRLQRYTDDAVERAVGAWLDIGKKFPTIADLIERVGPDGFEVAPGTAMQAMNAAIQKKQYEDKCVYRVTWLADENGTISGYRLDKGGCDEKRP